MPILRKVKERQYTTIDNTIINDKRADCSCKGFLLFMLSKPDDWKFNYKNFEAELPEGRRAISTMIKKLEQLGYLKRTRVNSKNGYWDWIYYISETTSIEKQRNSTIIPKWIDGERIDGERVDILNTNNTKDKLDKENLNPIYKREEHNFLTNLLIDKGYINEYEYDISNYDNLFNKYLKEDYSYNDLSTIASYIVSKVKERNFEDEDFNPIQNKFGYFKTSMDSNINQLLKPKEQTISDDILDYDWLNDDHDER